MSGATFTSPEWHLLELEIDGLGSDAGSRVLLIDGTATARVEGLDFSAAQINSLDLGAVYLDLGLAATVDIDDVRVDSAPQGDTLWPIVAQTSTGSCVICALPLTDWAGVPRVSPYTFPMTLSSSAGLSLYARRPPCTGPVVSGVTFQAGASMGPAVWAARDGAGASLGCRRATSTFSRAA